MEEINRLIENLNKYLSLLIDEKKISNEYSIKKNKERKKGDNELIDRVMQIKLNEKREKEDIIKEYIR